MINPRFTYLLYYTVCVWQKVPVITFSEPVTEPSSPAADMKQNLISTKPQVM